MNVEASDDVFRRWMRSNLVRSADRLGLTLMAPPVFGWRLRSISAPAEGQSGPCWLRVGSERSANIDAQPEFWSGNVDANVIPRVPKPRVIDWYEWTVQNRRVRAEVMTRLVGAPCAPGEVLRAELDLPDAWWAGLRSSLDTLRVVPTRRWENSLASKSWVRYRFGQLEVTTLETTHGDLHWGNLLGPNLGILDWELWGQGPAGYDAASLYCRSLLAPETAQRVHEVFADVLDSPAGRAAQLLVTHGLLDRISEFPELEGPLHANASRIQATAASSLR